MLQPNPDRLKPPRKICRSCLSPVQGRLGNPAFDQPLKCDSDSSFGFLDFLFGLATSVNALRGSDTSNLFIGVLRPPNNRRKLFL